MLIVEAKAVDKYGRNTEVLRKKRENIEHLMQLSASENTRGD